MRFLLLLLAVSLLGCVTYRSADSDESNPSYYRGPHGIPIGNSGAEIGGAGADGMVVAAAVALVHLATMPDYYRKTVIRGVLDCRSDPSIQIVQVCPTATVKIIGPNGKELARTRSDKEAFAFKVDKRGTYSIEVELPHYRLVSSQPTGLRAGDEVILHMKHE